MASSRLRKVPEAFQSRSRKARSSMSPAARFDSAVNRLSRRRCQFVGEELSVIGPFGASNWHHDTRTRFSVGASAPLVRQRPSRSGTSIQEQNQMWRKGVSAPHALFLDTPSHGLYSLTYFLEN